MIYGDVDRYGGDYYLVVLAERQWAAAEITPANLCPFKSALQRLPPYSGRQRMVNQAAGLELIRACVRFRIPPV
jgi:hypothetical protein